MPGWPGPEGQSPATAAPGRRPSPRPRTAPQSPEAGESSGLHLTCSPPLRWGPSLTSPCLSPVSVPGAPHLPRHPLNLGRAQSADPLLTSPSAHPGHLGHFYSFSAHSQAGSPHPRTAALTSPLNFRVLAACQPHPQLQAGNSRWLKLTVADTELPLTSVAPLSSLLANESITPFLTVAGASSGTLLPAHPQ